MNTQINTNKKWKFYIPSSFLIIIGLMFTFIVFSWILKAAGVQTDVWKDGERTTESIQGLGILDIFTSIWKGFKDKAEIILFILALGGLLGVISKTKAIDAGVDKIVTKLKGKEIFIIPVLMLFFGLGGTTYGMWEETIAFFPILIPVFIRAGYGPFPAILTILLGAGAGCLASTINPFAVGAAVTGANSGIKLLEGSETIKQSTLIGTRFIAFLFFEIIAIGFVMLFTWAVKNKKFQVHGLDEDKINKKFLISQDKIEFTKKRKITLAIFSFGFFIMILGYLPWSDWFSHPNFVEDPNFHLNSFNTWMNTWFFWLATTNGGWATWGDWYFISVAGVFLIITFIIFFINSDDFKSVNSNKEKEFIKTYVNGTADVLSVSLLIATASGFALLLTGSYIGPWIANSLAQGINKFGLVGYGVLMLFVSILLSLLIPSTSGFAASFMPIFGAIAFSGFPEQKEGAVALTILAFIFGSGIANLVTPTSAALMSYTSYSGVPYQVWLKYVWPVVVTFTLFAIVFILITAVSINNGLII